jgi:hypothetical protein
MLYFPVSGKVPSRSSGLAQGKRINWQNAVTVVSVAILVGTELVGLTWAAGWALGGMFQLPPTISGSFEVLGILVGCVLLYYFVRAALRAEPLRS